MFFSLRLVTFVYLRTARKTPTRQSVKNVLRKFQRMQCCLHREKNFYLLMPSRDGASTVLTSLFSFYFNYHRFSLFQMTQVIVQRGLKKSLLLKINLQKSATCL